MSRRRKPQRPNATGRNNTSRFVRLDYRLLHSNGFRSLSPNARSLLIELSMLYNGENNGSLYLGVKDAAHRMGVADHHAASRAFDELLARDFIEMTQDAYFVVKAAEKSRARTWRLKWLAGPGRKLPQWTFADPVPGTTEYKRMERGFRALKAYRKAKDHEKFPVVDSTMPGPELERSSIHAVVDSTPQNRENGGNPPNRCMVDSPHHIAVTMGNAVPPASIGWWHRDLSSPAANWVFAFMIGRFPISHHPHSSLAS